MRCMVASGVAGGGDRIEEKKKTGVVDVCERLFLRSQVSSDVIG